MKKVATGGFAVACVVAVFMVILASIGRMRQEKLRELPPLTLQDLDRLSKALPNPEAPAKDAVTPPDADKESPAEVAANPQPPANLPRRLNRPAMDEQRRELFTGGRSRRDRLLAVLGSSPLGSIADVALVAAGRPTGELWPRAQCNLMRGNWEEARICFTEFVRKSDEPMERQRACAYLAWLEDDPEMAARYMELASCGGDWYGTLLCVELATATGSTELAEKYIARGRSLVPDFELRLTEQGVFAKGL